MMRDYGFLNTTAFSCSTAAAGSSVPNVPILDTARILAVSICVLPLAAAAQEKP